MTGRTSSTFDELMARVAEGSQDAAWEIIQRYSANILRTVRRSLPDELRRKLDSVDIVQSVWKSLLAKNTPLDGLSSAAEFVAYIAGMAKKKVYEADRHYKGTKARDIRREVPYETTYAEGGGSDPLPTTTIGRVDLASDRPEMIVDVRERWKRSMETCGPRAAKIVELRLRRLSDEEICAQLGVSANTVRRDLQKLLESFVE